MVALKLPTTSRVLTRWPWLLVIVVKNWRCKPVVLTPPPLCAVSFLPRIPFVFKVVSSLPRLGSSFESSPSPSPYSLPPSVCHIPSRIQFKWLNTQQLKNRTDYSHRCPSVPIQFLIDFLFFAQLRSSYHCAVWSPPSPFLMTSPFCHLVSIFSPLSSWSPPPPFISVYFDYSPLLPPTSRSPLPVNLCTSWLPPFPPVRLDSLSVLSPLVLIAFHLPPNR